VGSEHRAPVDEDGTHTSLLIAVNALPISRLFRTSNAPVVAGLAVERQAI
jgi:hypothetical protein